MGINPAGLGQQSSNWPAGDVSRLAQLDGKKPSSPPVKKIRTTEDLRRDIKSGKVKVVGGEMGGPGGIPGRALSIARAIFGAVESAPGSVPNLEKLAGRIANYMEGRQGSYLNAFKGLNQGKDYRAMAQALDEASKGLATPSGCSPISKLHSLMNEYRTGKILAGELLQKAAAMGKASGNPGDLPWVVNQLRGAYQFKMPSLPPVRPSAAQGTNLGGLITGPRAPVTSEPILDKPILEKPSLPKPGSQADKHPSWLNKKPTQKPPEPR